MKTLLPNNQTQSPALWQLLQAAAEGLQAIWLGQSATAWLTQLPSQKRHPGVQALLYSTLRQLGRAQALRSILAPRIPAPAVDAMLCTSLALICQTEQSFYDDHTLVNQAVEAVKKNKKTVHQANFLNACLRRFLREKATLMSQTDRQEQARYNHPSWWIEQLKQDHPDHWEQVLQSSQMPGPMTLRVNPRKTTPQALLGKWQTEGIKACWLGGSALMLEKPLPVEKIPGFLEGECSVQDASAQWAAPLLLDALNQNQIGPHSAKQPFRLLDACAAPGGKTAHLLEISDSEVCALEIDPVRAQRIEENLKRLRLKAEILVTDANDTSKWFNGENFDGILLDAPCSASGIVRRHPDIPWLRRPTDLVHLPQQQQRLLNKLWPLLKPGGVLLYCTCSVFKAEGQQQVEAFVASNTQANLLPSPGHLMPQNHQKPPTLTDNRVCDQDGFYYALLQKTTR